MRSSAWTLALFLLFAPSLAWSTPASFGHVQVAQDLTAPAYDNPDDLGDAYESEWSTTITEGVANNSQWMRIHFDRVNIGMRDIIRFRSVVNGWEYEVRGNDLYARGAPRVDIAHFSLFMPGNSVEVELLSEDASFGGGLHIDYVHVGTPSTSDLPCQVDQDPLIQDSRVCRIVAYRDLALFGGNHYVTCSGVLMFPGSCILTSAEALDGVTLDKQNVIVQFGTSLEPIGGGSFAVRGHSPPGDQYRFLESTDCVGSVNGHVLSFRVRPNEHTGDTPGYAYGDPWWFGGPQIADAFDIDVNDPIIVRGYADIGDWSSASQSSDRIWDPAGGPNQDKLTFVNANGWVEHNSQGTTFGYEGAPIMEDRDLPAADENERVLYGLNIEPSCGLPADQGTTFRDPDLDMDNALSCVRIACNGAASEYPLIGLIGGYHQAGLFTTMTMTLGGPQMSVRATGGMQLVTTELHMFGDGKWRQWNTVTALHARGVSCVGTVDVRLDPTRQQSLRVIQVASGALYPAYGLLELALVLEVGGIEVTTQTPVQLEATVDDTPGYGVVWTLAAPVGLVDAQLQTVGTLDTWSVQIVKPRTELSVESRLELSALGPVQLEGELEVELSATKWSEPLRLWSTPLQWKRTAQSGNHPTAGVVILRQSPSLLSNGVMSYPFRPDTMPLQHQSELYVEIELTESQQTLVNPQPIQLVGRWTDLLPIGDTLRSAGPVALHDKVTQQFVMMLDELVMIGQDPTNRPPLPEAAIDASCASGLLVLDVGQGPMTLGGLQGRTRMMRHEPEPEPYIAYHIPIELLSMDLEASGTPLGDVIVRRAQVVAVGAIDQQSHGSPLADAWFDVFLEVQTAGGVLRNTQAVRIAATVDSIPLQQQLASQTGQPPVPLVDGQGNPAGQLHYFSLTPGMLYDDGCPSGISCSAHMLAAGDPPTGRSGRIRLLPAAPNPMRDAVRLTVDMPGGAEMRLGVYDLAGRLVHEVARGKYASGGTRQFEWRGVDAKGGRVAPGVYFVRLHAGADVQTRTVVLQR